ncbi:dimethylmenaquinone methyltransferase [Deinococcus piscis]|uniref:Regulator of ribonuclease activity homolog n=1 Tax=Deinococcus piscis TaxID=394230 RepID=A0ABQ3K7B4_9DEIO|nr:RraA family protein [Deinococcus piscis]GHG06979.1 dimethylmenaquinone methyltransferase [Deinococcus piscis]
MTSTTAPPTTAFGSLLTGERVLDYHIRPLYTGMPGLSGPAFTVRLEPGCNLMLHAAIYHAPVGSVLVVQSPDRRHAVAGGNVCLTAQQNGIAGMVIDGVIRDRAEIEAARFPVFALGTSPIPGSKEPRGEWQQPLQCGGVTVHPGDWIVADSEGILCLPAREAPVLLDQARQAEAKEAAQSLEAWQAEHRRKVDSALAGCSGN